MASSLNAALQTLLHDARMVRIGAHPGWYTWTHYKGRVHSRLRKPSTTTATRLHVKGVPVSVFVTPQHLGALRGVFLDNEYDVSRILPGFSPTTILDLGANVGMAAAYLHAMFPDAQFVCVEPDPRNHGLLERTLQVNAINASVVRAAVASRPGMLKLRFGEDPTCSALESSPMHQHDSAVEVNVVTVPQLLATAGWGRVDLVKIDIEGSERELLSRNNEWLNLVGAMVLEIHPNTSPAEIQSFIQTFGFVVERAGDGGEPVYLAQRR